MKLLVLEAFSPALGTNYNVGDQIEIADEKAAQSLIDSKRAMLLGTFHPYENFNPFAAQDKAKKSVTPKVPTPLVPVVAPKPVVDPKAAAKAAKAAAKAAQKSAKTK